ncbi:hypothetical protein BGP77_17270 [Saccharospirillum sp. MSK14-1]|nr:hypothetical protein BGP77_17270 [Saccharospirillum sp. MSK14-1]
MEYLTILGAELAAILKRTGTDLLPVMYSQVHWLQVLRRVMRLELLQQLLVQILVVAVLNEARNI